ncbi:MAG TPA: helix-turn-helix transcriptional regulator [Niabella sp.]|nr:helix-turn-helix transcriptional regulator [Bacteroidia bacterium]HOZ90984.1 helix-turn-helix transcriptional regulator [Bacteroidia bacterium]HRB52083.1 helix-turn-helix transcriptional regulator [Bacteroidia bacterium]HRC03081.1 helix-turn-helix transcriptional regulator [Niabella sp.]
MDSTTEKTLQDLGRKVKMLREAKDISQDELASKLNLVNGHSYISKIEKGAVNITIEKMCEVLSVLDCEFTVFVKPNFKLSQNKAKKTNEKKGVLKPKKISFTS